MSIIIARNTNSQDSNEIPRVIHTTCSAEQQSSLQLLLTSVAHDSVCYNHLTLCLFEL